MPAEARHFFSTSVQQRIADGSNHAQLGDRTVLA
jgi:hypothetical protein